MSCRYAKSRYGGDIESSVIFFTDGGEENDTSKDSADVAKDKPSEPKAEKGIGITDEQRNLLLAASVEQTRQNAKINSRADQLIREDFENPEGVRAAALELTAQFVRECLGEKVNEGMVLSVVVREQDNCITQALEFMSNFVAQAAEGIGLAAPEISNESANIQQQRPVAPQTGLAGLGLDAGSQPAATPTGVGGVQGITGLSRDIDEDKKELIYFLNNEPPKPGIQYREKQFTLMQDEKDKTKTIKIGRHIDRNAQELIDLIQ